MVHCTENDFVSLPAIPLCCQNVLEIVNDQVIADFKKA